MASTPTIYRRLTRSAAGAVTYSSLWLAPDHLLIATSNGYSERYARLQLRDIKTFFLTRSDRSMWWGMLWGMMAGLGAIVMMTRLLSGQTPVFSVAFLVLGASAFTWNFLIGPGCRAYVITGVQTAPLPALVRMKKARLVLAQLQPLIEAAQADMVEATPAVGTSPPTSA